MTIKDTYITATNDLLRGGADFEQVMNGLRTTLRDRGHEQLESSILAGLLRLATASSQAATVLTVASEADAAVYADKIAAATEPMTVIDPTLIGGYVLEEHNVRHDASYKTALLKLYRRITT